jgi:nucleoid DNA-binding protein
MNFRRKYKHRKIINEIAEKTNLDPRIIHLIIRKFYGGLRKLLNRNEEVNIQGFFTLKLEKSKRKIIDEKGKGINLRKRKDQRYNYVKKGYKKKL